MNAEKLEAEFWRFAGALRIESRDAGSVVFKPWGTQRRVVHELATGLAAGIHEFLVLKPRQVGISTVMLAWTLFWLLKHKTMHGALITQGEKATEYLRSVLTRMAQPVAETAWGYPMTKANRVQVAWANGSRLLFETAGKRKNSGLGKARGLAYLHATEVSEWGDAEGVESLRAALSEQHPAACYVWESTAQGFNFFFEMWEEFSRATSLRAIFVAWWMHELYRVDRASRQFEVYWDGALSPEEGAWQDQIAKRWGETLEPEQWAWFRWKQAEKQGSLLSMMQNFPTLPEHAFQASGQGYVDDAVLFRLREGLDIAPAAKSYVYSFADTIEGSALVPTDPKRATLTVWEPPVAGCHYVVAGDPAYGANDESDQAVCSVWRCERRRLVQVAEFAAVGVPTQKFAWVCMHLAGTYDRAPGQAHFILELQGPGLAVLQDIQNVQFYGYGSDVPQELQQVVGNIRHYIYRRPDHMGAGGLWQWQSTSRTKKMIFERLRSCLLSNAIVIRSRALVEELGGIKQTGDKFGAVGRQHDDRAITAAMATEAWLQQALPVLLTQGPTPGDEEPVYQPASEMPPGHVRVVRRFFDELGVSP